jgi:hypothetical protein
VLLCGCGCELDGIDRMSLVALYGGWATDVLDMCGVCEDVSESECLSLSACVCVCVCLCV